MQNSLLVVAFLFACGCSLLIPLAIQWLIKVFFERDVRYFTCWWVFMLSSTILTGIWHVAFSLNS